MPHAIGNCNPAIPSACSPAVTGFSPGASRGGTVIPGRLAEPNLESRDSGPGASAPSRNDSNAHRPRPKSPPPFTFQPLLVCNNGGLTSGVIPTMRAILAISALLALSGCMSDNSQPEQPAMYLSMANGGATLDPHTAASMISQYRQNNGLGK